MLPSDGMDDELVAVSHYDDVGGVDWEALGFMQQPKVAAAAFGGMDSMIPWADLNGPRRSSASSCLPVRSGGQDLPKSQVTHMAKTWLINPKVNPCSEFGFITVTVPASSYIADANDILDIEFARHLMSLSEEAANALELRRLEHGKYEVQGKRLLVQWADPHGCDLMAFEQTGLNRDSDREGEVPATADDDEPMPLSEYLSHMGQLAVAIKRPAERRALTFPDGDEGIEDRCESMRIACEQARLREQVADACRRDKVIEPTSQGVPFWDVNQMHLPHILPPQMLLHRA